jgi:hypothetical protein
VRAITMEDRLRRYRVAQKAQQYADEIIKLYVDTMRDVEKVDLELRPKAGKWLWEAAFGKPGQAIQMDVGQATKTELIVRWMPPDPNDRSNVTIPEPD